MTPDSCVCRLSGVKRTCLASIPASANDPTPTCCQSRLFQASKVPDESAMSTLALLGSQVGYAAPEP